MTNFDFQTDSEGKAFCESIVQEMLRKFGISRGEAVGRMNAAWKGLTIDKDDVIFHEDEEYWANTLYYGKDSQWWTSPPGLKPLPYNDK